MCLIILEGEVMIRGDSIMMDMPRMRVGSGCGWDEGLEGLEGKELLWPGRFSGSCASDILAIVCKLVLIV